MKNRVVHIKDRGDYELPNLQLPSEKTVEIGVWEKQYRRYLKQNHRICYYNLLAAGTLVEHITDIDRQAERMFESLVISLTEQENITEKMKTIAPTEWVQKMNNIRNRATEIVIYKVISDWESKNIIFIFQKVNAVFYFKILFGFWINCV